MPAPGTDAPLDLRLSALVVALTDAGRACSITELAGLMSCSTGEASKRVRAAAAHVRVARSGRYKLVTLTPRKPKRKGGSP